MGELAISDVAEQTGIAAGTIRIWEQRHGFPEPARTSGGYRRYSEEDVEILRRVLAFRERGLSVSAALERARAASEGPTDRPSIYAAVASAEPGAAPAQRLRKRTLNALSRAIEDEALSRASAPVLFGAFQEERFYRPVEHRYRRITEVADAAVVFADFPAGGRRPEGGPAEIPIARDDALGNEWAVILDAPGYAACLLAWEHPGDPGDPGDPDRRFEAMWTIDPQVTRRASLVAAALAGRSDPELGERLESMLADRPLALERPAPGLTALTNRIVAYLEAP
jgi:MerR family transcriptional regulator, light-induced transcriptional regulator